MRHVIATLQYVFRTLSTVGQLVVGVAGKSWKSGLLFQVLHYAFVAITLIVLTIVGLRLYYDQTVVLPVDNGFLQRFWLPLVFVLVYLAARLIVYVIRMLLAREAAEFDDVQAAWERGLAELDRCGVDVDWVPLFLVLGLRREDEANFFAASQLEWKSVVPEEGERAPLRFYFNDDAIYVSCPDVGCAAEHFRKIGFSDGPPEERRNAPAASESAPDLGEMRTIPPGGMPAEPATVAPSAASAATAPEPGGTAVWAEAGATMMPGGRATMPPPAIGGAAPAAPDAVRLQVPPLSKQEAELQTRRLEYLAELVTESRHEQGGMGGRICPVNGVLLALPLELTASSTGLRAVESAQRDCDTLFDAFGLSFPLVVAYTGLENLVGLAEFVQRAERTERRIRFTQAGSRYPLGHQLDDSSAEWLVSKAIEGWFQGWVYGELSTRVGDEDNRRLFQFVCELIERRDRIVRQLERLFDDRTGRRGLRMAGLYFVACGKKPKHHAFVQGVLKRLEGYQSEVAWTPDRLQSDASSGRYAKFVFAAALLCVVAEAWFLWQYVWNESAT